MHPLSWLQMSTDETSRTTQRRIGTTCRHRRLSMAVPPKIQWVIVCATCGSSGWVSTISRTLTRFSHTNPDTTHFSPWAEVGDIQNHRPREVFKARPGMKRRIRPERGNHDPVTELECFEEMFTPEMPEGIIRCTNDKIVRIQNGIYPKPTRATIWPPK